jgi:flavin-dependent dehydrogenase
MDKRPSSKHQFTRREFMELSRSASIAFLLTPKCLSARDTVRGNHSLSEVAFQRAYLPVINKCDVVIVGGSFAGVSAALEFVRAGKKVVLVERRIYLGREMTSTCRPWIKLDENTSPDNLPEALRLCIDKEISQPFKNKILFRFDKIKLGLEDALLGEGVEIIYISHPVQLIVDKNVTGGLVIGNKSGRQAILAKMILDCTESASVIRLTNIGFKKARPEMSSFIRTLEFTQIESLEREHIDVPESLKIKGDRVLVQRGYIGDQHYYVDCPMEFPDPSFDTVHTVKREVESWERSIGVARYLYEKVPEFKNAFLTASSYQLTGFYTGQMNDLAGDNPANVPEADISLTDNHAVGSLSFATNYPSIWCINEAAHLEKSVVEFLMSPQGASVIGTACSKWLLREWDQLVSKEFSETLETAAKVGIKNGPTVIEQESPQRGRVYEQVKTDRRSFPIIDRADVLVVGGGSSGATSAIVAAESGKKTVVVDMNPGFGGTGTFSGVQDYWGKGTYKGFVARHIRNMNDVHKYIPDYVKKYASWWDPYVTWNVQAKMYMLLREVKKAGAEIILNSVAIGTIMDGKRVRGVVLATPQGVYGILSKVVIDATGDGDIAAFAGADFVYGSARDHVPMWYALCKVDVPGITITSFQSTIDVTNIHDYSRSVMVGMRSGGRLHDHYPYLAPRETRHIYGDVVLTLTDHLKFRKWEDVINISYGNCDMKGYHASDWFRIGLIPPNVDVEIPYRCIVPKNIENILVAGKAFSSNHESMATVRMQPDLENLGGIAALAAVQALEEGVLPRDINIRKLQNKLVKLELLPAEVLSRNIKPREHSRKELEAFVEQFEPGRSLHSYSDTALNEMWDRPIPFVEVCASPAEKAVPVLEKALMSSSGKKAIRIAQALAMLGSESGAQTLFNEINKQLTGGKLPKLDENIRHAGGDAAPPGQGAMPLCANLIYALGMTRSGLNILVGERVGELFKPEGSKDFYSKELGLFYYVDAVCYSAELLGSKEAIPALKQLHDCQYLKNQSLKTGIEGDFILERRALLELILARALARSGDIDGLKILIEYLDDMRAVLAEFAHTTLIRITNHDFGKNKNEWTGYVNAINDSFKPVPLIERVDG